MITKIKGKCQYEDCDQTATTIACGRFSRPDPGLYCEHHAEIVADDNHPEYHTSCPNCGCHFGVN